MYKLIRLTMMSVILAGMLLITACGNGKDSAVGNGNNSSGSLSGSGK